MVLLLFFTLGEAMGVKDLVDYSFDSMEEGIFNIETGGFLRDDVEVPNYWGAGFLIASMPAVEVEGFSSSSFLFPSH